MSEVFNFNFDKLQKQCISKEATLNFLKTKTENNFNFDELENTFKSNGYTQEQITNAMYHSLQEANKSGDLWLRPLPQNDLVSGNHLGDYENFETADSMYSPTANLNHSENPHPCRILSFLQVWVKSLRIARAVAKNLAETKKRIQAHKKPTRANNKRIHQILAKKTKDSLNGF